MGRIDRTGRATAAVAATMLVTACSLSGCGDSSGSGGGGGSSPASSVAASVTSTTSTQASTAASTAAQVSSSSGPITCDMPVTNIPEGECNLLTQNCGPGRTCTIDIMGMTATTVCADTNGFKPRGAACGSDTECQAGLVCVNKCTPVCCPSTNEPCMGGECNLNVTIDGTDLTFLVCAYNDSCELFTPMACPMGEECHPTDGIATCVSPSPNPVMEGEVCEAINDCGDMQACIGQDAEYRCRYACMMGSMAAPGMGGCPAGQSCQPVQFNIPDVGACLPT